MSRSVGKIGWLTLVAIALGGLVSSDVHGDEPPPRLKIGNVEMIRNGSGVRTKSLIPLYQGTLYLTQRSSDAAAIIEADAAMGIRIEITSIFVSQSTLVEALSEGFRQAAGNDLAGIETQVKQFRECFGEKIAKGDVFHLVYLPPHGVVVLKNGQTKGVVAGRAFKQALFAIWFSDRPADASLKRGMLGL